MNVAQNAEYNAYYAGRNDVWNGDAPRSRADFATAAEWESYCRGLRSARAENRLDADTEWD